MNIRDTIENYIGHSCGKKGSEESYYCPKCGWKNPRFMINYDLKKFHCWYCGWGGSVITAILWYMRAPIPVIQEMETYLGIEKTFNRHTQEYFEKESLSEKVTRKLLNDTSLHNFIQPNISIPTNFYTFKEYPRKKNLLYIDALYYLKNKRKLSDYEIDLYDLRFSDEINAILIPSYDINNRLNYFTMRYLKGRYVNVQNVSKMENIFFENFIDFSQPVILTEGTFDAMRIGYNAIPLMGIHISKHLKNRLIENKTPEVILFLDSDANKIALNNALDLYKLGINVKLLQYEGVKDAGSINKEDIPKFLKKVIPINKMNLIKLKIESKYYNNVY